MEKFLEEGIGESEETRVIPEHPPGPLLWRIDAKELGEAGQQLRSGEGDLGGGKSAAPGVVPGEVPAQRPDTPAYATAQDAEMVSDLPHPGGAGEVAPASASVGDADQEGAG